MPTHKEKMAFRRAVLTARQAAEYLHVTPGRVGALVTQGTLIPVFKEGRVTLFLREDVEGYAKNHPPRPDGRRRKPLPPRVQRFIEAGSFDLMVSTVREALSALDDVVAVSVYFWRWDAVRHGFYWAEDPLDRDVPFWPVRTATLIVRDVHRYEVWMEYANCGYRGEFPAATNRILTDLGIPAVIRDQVYTRQILHYSRSLDLGPWEVDPPALETLALLTPESSRQTPMFWRPRRDALVFFGDPASLNGPFLTHYQLFLENPQTVYFFPAGQGVVVPDEAGRPWEYTVLLEDEYGRQLWLVPARPIPEALPHQLSLHEIFDWCGIRPDEDTTASYEAWLAQPVQPRSWRLAAL